LARKIVRVHCHILSASMTDARARLSAQWNFRIGWTT
jgi:hypothetical protein